MDTTCEMAVVSVNKGISIKSCSHIFHLFSLLGGKSSGFEMVGYVFIVALTDYWFGL